MGEEWIEWPGMAAPRATGTIDPEAAVGFDGTVSLIGVGGWTVPRQASH